jgi:preprotein translocase subunit SecG
MDEIITNSARKRVAPLTVVLGIVFVFFCVVLVYVYAETKRINPVMLDEHGHPIGQTSQQSANGGKR